jgi:hypothetical protein
MLDLFFVRAVDYGPYRFAGFFSLPHRSRDFLGSLIRAMIDEREFSKMG